MHTHRFLVTRTWLRNVRLFAIANPSVVCNNVRAPYSGVEIFDNNSSSFCTFVILWPPRKRLQRSSQENSSVGDVKRKGGSKIERCYIRVFHLLMSFLLYWWTAPSFSDREKTELWWKSGKVFNVDRLCFSCYLQNVSSYWPELRSFCQPLLFCSTTLREGYSTSPYRWAVKLVIRMFSQRIKREMWHHL